MKINIFQKARIKLIFYYIGIMAIILIAFSSVLVFTIESKVRQGFQDRIIITGNIDDLVNKASDGIKTLIYTIDALLLIIIGISSYFLADKTLNPINEALDAQKKFSADASHDLRTPLAVIMTESDVVLQNSKSSEKELRSIIESNREEAKKMSKLVSDLLLIARGENQAISNSFVEVDLHGFIEKIVKKMKIQAVKKGLNLKVSEYQKILLKIDVSSFGRAVSNIVQNAINYTKEGSVSIDLRQDSKKVYLTVSDTGVGIDQKDLSLVFNRFYKGVHSRNDKSGSGLGLPITKMIVEEHKGTIDIESKVGVGTRVVVIIPLLINSS